MITNFVSAVFVFTTIFVHIVGQKVQESHFAGSNGGTCGEREGIGADIQFRAPGCLSASARGLLVCDDHNRKLRLIPIDQKNFGQPERSRTIFSSSGSLSAVTESANGEIFVADVHNQQIQKIGNGKVIVIAGHQVSPAMPTVDGRGQDATFKRPQAIVTDSHLNIYVADSLDQKIRCIARRSNIVTTLAGSGLSGFVDGAGSKARFQQPSSLALWHDTILVADTGNNAIRAVDISSATVSLVAGSKLGDGGWSDGVGSKCLFQAPSAIERLGDMLIVVERGGGRVRTIHLVSRSSRTLHSLPTVARQSLPTFAKPSGLASFFPPPPAPTTVSASPSTNHSEDPLLVV